MGESVSRYLQRLREEPFALGGELDILFSLAEHTLLFHALEHLHPEIAGEVIVANPRAAQRRILGPGAHPQMTGPRRKSRKAFKHAGHIRVGEPVVAVTTLLFLLDQPAAFEFGEMGTGSLRR